jgi:hypothetical protein
MPTGALVQLNARGEQDLYLTGNPKMTYFQSIYKRHTNFASESIRQELRGQIDFGQHVWVDIQRKGDLVNEIFLEVTIPTLNPIPENNPGYHASWINSIGHFLIQTVDLTIGGQLIDRHYGQWLEIWTELSMSAAKKEGYNFMVGKHEFLTSFTQEDEMTVYIPLQFWFCRYSGLSLPLIALQHHDVRIDVTFNQFNKLWMSNNGVQPGLGTADSSILCDYKIIDAALFVEYIYLDDAERKYFVNKDHEYLIEQLQVHTEGIPKDIATIDLAFNHPVKEIIWVIQTKDLLTTGIETGNNLSDFSNGDPDNPTDPILRAKIEFEGIDRISERKAQYFRLIEPFYRHTRVPNNFIYLYSFAKEPEKYQPSGTCNFSKIDNPRLWMQLKAGLNDPVISIYAINYNILEITKGTAALKYSS